MKKYLLFILGLALLTGCGPARIEPNSDVEVGIVKGKSLHRLSVSDGGGSTHYVYYFPTDKQQPISNNMRMGKISTVIVLIDGKPISTNVVILEDPIR